MPTNIASCRAAGAAIAMALTFSVGAQVANTTATSQFGAWGYDGTGADKSTKPGNDFFGFANGTWLDHTQIPPDKPAISLRLLMTDRTEARLHDIMERAAATGRTLSAEEGRSPDSAVTSFSMQVSVFSLSCRSR